MVMFFFRPTNISEDFEIWQKNMIAIVTSIIHC